MTTANATGIIRAPKCTRRSPALFQILNIIAPVFLLIGLGWALMRWQFFAPSVLHEVNRLCYWVALPALLFHRMAENTPDFAAAGDLLLVILGATLLGMAIAAAFAWISPMKPISRGAFVQGAFRGNMVFVGLPVVLYAFDASGLSTSAAEATALLIIGPTLVMYNVLAVSILVFSSGAGASRTAIRSAMISIITNPMLLSCAVGLSYAGTGLGMTMMVDNTLEAVGQLAFPLALICIGGALYLTPLKGQFGYAAVGALMKVALLPAIGLALGAALDFSPENQLITALMLASPTAAASYILTRQLRGDDAMASGILLLSHILAIPALVVILALLGV